MVRAADHAPADLRALRARLRRDRR
jgi:hypothetical protein